MYIPKGSLFLLLGETHASFGFPILNDVDRKLLANPHAGHYQNREIV
jgi:hypothetical protein